MRYRAIVVALGLSAALLEAQTAQNSPPFTVEQVLGLPTPDNLIAAPTGSTIAWTFNERGVRNVYAADGPAFVARKLTNNTADDGQELTNLSFSRDGKTIVYVRGGDHGGSRPGDAPNPQGEPVAPKMQIWAVAAAGGSAPKLLAEGDAPAISPDGAHVVFTRERKLFVVPTDGSKTAEPLFVNRGASESPRWSPDGKTLAFVSNRGDHSFIGLFTPGQPIRYVDPKTTRDDDPVWSLDGRRIAFVRSPGGGGAPRSPLEEPQQSWSLMVADVSAPDEAIAVATSGEPIDPIARSPVGVNAHWAANDTLVFFSYRDGWQHLYAIRNAGKTAGDAAKPVLLTPGSFMVEQIAFTPDHKTIVYNANTGGDAADIDRRHLFKVAVDGATPTPVTGGAGIEWGPAVTGDGKTIAFVSAEAKRPPVPAVASMDATAVSAPTLVAADHIARDFPTDALVVPQPVVFNASDGAEVHGQLFRAPNRRTRGPAIVYVHGGGPRQMLLGWHYRWEYADDYAINQYFASRGFIVLSVNYRLSVGYGAAYEFPEHAGARGASEYRDVQAAGLYLQRRPDVDPRSIGVWGASYGGYLTALALGRDPDIFAAGVDLHGVHDRLPAVNPSLLAHAIVGDGITEDELKDALAVEFKSSPISTIDTWRSPVLFVHGDDDRTVDFRQTIELRARLAAKGVRVDELVLPDEVHDALLWRSWVRTAAVAAAFFDDTLKAKR